MKKVKAEIKGKVIEGKCEEDDTIDIAIDGNGADLIWLISSSIVSFLEKLPDEDYKKVALKAINEKVKMLREVEGI